MRFTAIMRELLKNRIDDQFTALHAIQEHPDKNDERREIRTKIKLLQLIEHLISTKQTAKLADMLARFECYDNSIKSELLDLVVSRLDVEAAHYEEVV